MDFNLNANNNNNNDEGGGGGKGKGINSSGNSDSSGNSNSTLKGILASLILLEEEVQQRAIFDTSCDHQVRAMNHYIDDAGSTLAYAAAVAGSDDAGSDCGSVELSSSVGSSVPQQQNRRLWVKDPSKDRRISQTWEKESETLIEDGHQWRKYGQKVILNATYPRNYYRCTHKYDQGCKAIKQVWRVQKEPPLYKTTYYGQHTCRNLLNLEIILDSNSPSDSSVSLALKSDNTLPPPPKQHCPFLSSSSFPSPSLSLKKDCKEEIPSSYSSNDYLLSPYPTFDNNSSRHVTLSSTLDSDHRDVMSGVFYDSAELDQVFEPFLEFDV